MKKFRRYVLILCILLSAFILMACNADNPSTQTNDASSQTDVKGNQPYDYENLFSYKSEYIGDASNVRNLLNDLAYPRNLPIEKIELQTDNPPYRLAIFLKLNLGEGQEYTVDYSMIAKDSAILFALIDNLDAIDYNFRQADYGMLFSITREDTDSLLCESSKTYGENKEAFCTDLPPKIEALSYHPDVKSIITYDGDIMGKE